MTLHQQVIFERARLAFVGVARDVLGVWRLLVDELPLHPGRKACAAAAAQARRSSTRRGASSGVSRSCQALFTITTGALSHAPRHSTSTSVNMPLASVWPGLILSLAVNDSVTRSAPFSAHGSVRHTCSRKVPTGLVWNIV